MINTDNSGSMILEGAISVFSRALKDNHQIHFLNLYNGVKVECQGSVIAVEDETVVCKVTLEQILAMKGLHRARRVFCRKFKSRYRGI